jgi:hypothetical protein
MDHVAGRGPVAKILPKGFMEDAIAGRGVAESLTSMGKSLLLASTTKSSSLPIEVRQK